MSCRDCVFRGIFQDMGASCDVCNLQSDLVDAVKACENSAGCRHRFTVKEAKKIVIEREGRLPTIIREKTKPSEKSESQRTINEAFAELAEAACDAIKRLRETLNPFVQTASLMNNNRCIVCGAIIPEGRQVCPICEKKGEKK